MGIFNLDPEKAKAAQQFRNAVDDLKPKGTYEVSFIDLHAFDFDEDSTRVPSISIQLVIHAYLGEKGDQVVPNSSTGKNAFANARLFYKVYLSEAGIFGLINVLESYTETVWDAGELSDKLNSFKTSDAFVSWVKGQLNATTKKVWVGQQIPDADGKAKGYKPQNTVRFINS